MIEKDEIKEILAALYDKLFNEPMLAHLFHGKDRDALIAKQLIFTEKMLGDQLGRKEILHLAKVHQPLKIRSGHFRRRQMILKETLAESSVCPTQQRRWLDVEQRFYPQIVQIDGCR